MSTYASLEEEEEAEEGKQKKEPTASDNSSLRNEQNVMQAPLERAGILSRICFWWLNPLFKVGARQPLTADDLYPLPKTEQSAGLSETLTREWCNTKHPWFVQRPNYRLAWSIAKAFRRSILISALGAILHDSFLIGQQTSIGLLVGSLYDGSSREKSFGLATALVLCSVGQIIMHHVYFYWVYRLGMQIRTAVVGTIMHKSMMLSQLAISSISTGHVLNMVSSDSQRFESFTLFMHCIWRIPIITVVILTLVYQYIGAATFAGFAVYLIMIPVQLSIGKRFSVMRGRVTLLTDRRVKLMNEILTGMRVVKLYAWENAFGKVIAQVRKLEIKCVRAISLLGGSNYAFYSVSPVVVSFLAFLVYDLDGSHDLTSQRVFGTMALLNVLQSFIGYYCALVIQTSSEWFVALQRIGTFLNTAEYGDVEKTKRVDRRKRTVKSNSDAYEMAQLNESSDEEDGEEIQPVTASRSIAVNYQHASCSWSLTQSPVVLDDLNFSISKGEVLAVVGAVGCGKSSLLLATLKELSCIHGRILVNGSVSYAPQEPWILAGTVKENILLNRNFDADRYGKVVAACALLVDFEQFPHGDDTLIGDRGVTLSGGQRARVGLARAMYEEADVYLLDDPLSAVDMKVGNTLFQEGILAMTRERGVTCVLVTHQLQILPLVDRIALIAGGRVTALGSYTELVERGEQLEIFTVRNDQHSTDSVADAVPAETAEDMILDEPVLKTTDTVTAILKHTTTSNQLFDKELEAVGSVGASVYLQYFKAASGIVGAIVVVVLCVIGQAASIVADWWLARWSGLPPSERHYDSNLGIYGGIVALAVVLSFTRAYAFFRTVIRSSQKLHDSMFTSVVGAPMSFFDTTPAGRILNRFAKDVAFTDDVLPPNMFETFTSMLMCTGALLIVAISNPYLFIVAVPLLGFFVWLRKYYLKTARQLKRLEGTSRSPAFGLLASCLQGLVTIRTLKQNAKFLADFNELQDANGRAWFLVSSVNRWIGFRLDVMAWVFIAANVFACVGLSSTLSSGVVGLTLVYAMTLADNFQWTVRLSAEVENQMTSVERLLEYTHLPQETDSSEATTRELTPEASAWPQHGALEVRNCSMRYRAGLPLALTNLNFSVAAGTKVGIVGRTGAGKSSIISLIMRLSNFEGDVIIDGLSSSLVTLQRLRSSISVIPQEPVLFSGTIQMNLDPFGLYTENEIWKSLEAVHLAETLRKTQGLASVVSESGTNWSIGQRQLICLARAILRRNKILLLDEATANVDYHTDRLIQETIRSQFANCTVLTIAHRLATIMDSDKVLVLDKGSVVEFDSPARLLKRESGAFYQLVHQMGAEAAASAHRQAAAKSL